MEFKYSLYRSKVSASDDINSRVQTEIILAIPPGFQKRKGFFHTQDGRCIHDIAAEVAIVEDALADHGLHDTFLHEALGLWLGIEGYNFDLAFSSGLFHGLPGGWPIIGIESDEAGQVRIFLNSGLSIAQRDFGLDIVVQAPRPFPTQYLRGYP